MGVPSAADRWRRRGFVAAVLEAIAVLAPGAAGVITALVIPSVLRPDGFGTTAVAWVASIVLGAGVAVIADRLLRRILPLVVLLRLSLEFPDRAPSRFRIALRAGTLRNLESRLAVVAENGVDGDPSDAAAQMLELLSALTRYDRRTRGHSERVRAFADLIAAELRLPAVERDRLRWSALLHDIGKLHVDVGILNKPGKLDGDEWDAIRSHPHVGARIAAPLLPWLGEWGTAIEHHHERWDGSGYPRGISRDDIALGARIVAVADAFEVMTAARSYKQPMGVAEARQELLDCAGEQFDPHVVRALFAVSMTRLRWVIGPAAFLALIPGVRRAWAFREAFARRPAVRAGFAALFAALAIPATEGSTNSDMLPGDQSATADAATTAAGPEATFGASAGAGWAIVKSLVIERDVTTAPARPTHRQSIIERTAPTPEALDPFDLTIDLQPVPEPARNAPPTDPRDGGPAGDGARPDLAQNDAGSRRSNSGGARPSIVPPGSIISDAARSGGRSDHGDMVSAVAHQVEKPSGQAPR